MLKSSANMCGEREREVEEEGRGESEREWDEE